MGRTCVRQCIKYKATGPPAEGRYKNGQKRCQQCEIYIKWEGLWCPCCGYRLRSKPRAKKYKSKLQEAS